MPISHIKLGLIGVGKWGKNYISTVNQLSGVSLSWIVSTKRNIKNVDPSCNVTSNWRDLLNAKELDGIIFAVPPLVQEKIALEIIKSKIPLLLEKPLALSYESSRLLMKASIKFDTYVQVNHIYLFHPAYKEIFNLLPLIGSIREIYSIGGNWGPFRDSHSSLWDWMPHDVSMCMKVVGTRPKVISSEIKVLKKNGEIIKSTLGFNQNIRAYITCGNGFKEKKRFFKIVAENGTIIFDDLAKDKLKLIMGKDTEIIPFKYESPLCLSVSSFSRSILKQEHLNSDIKFAVDVAQVIANIERKLRDIN